MGAMPSVAAVHEDMHERAREEWKPDEKAEDVSTVFREQQRTGYHQKTQEDDSDAPRQKARSNGMLMVRMIVQRHSAPMQSNLAGYPAVVRTRQSVRRVQPNVSQ
jgi:hypothetical protein